MLFRSSRLVFVLLDQSAFSEDTLRNLCELIAKRYPAPDNLYLYIYTNLEQTPTPEENDLLGTSSSPEEMTGAELTFAEYMKKYPFALYMRSHGNESVHYVDSRTTQTEKVVVIKGKDLLRKNR